MLEFIQINDVVHAKWTIPSNKNLLRIKFKLDCVKEVEEVNELRRMRDMIDMLTVHVTGNTWIDSIWGRWIYCAVESIAIEKTEFQCDFHLNKHWLKMWYHGGSLDFLLRSGDYWIRDWCWCYKLPQGEDRERLRSEYYKKYYKTPTS